jgi:hypothetical protein
MAEFVLLNLGRRTAGGLKFTLLSAAFLTAPTICGCRNLDRAQTDAMERELRQQEDYIYELENYVMEYSEKLRQARITGCEPGTIVTPKSSNAKSPLREPVIDEDLPTTPRLPLNGRNKVIPPPTSSPAVVPPKTDSAAATPATETAKPQAPVESPPAAAPPEKPKPEEMEAPPLEIGTGASSLPWKKTGSLAKASMQAVAPIAPLLIPDPVDYQVEADGSTTAATKPTDADGARPAAAEKPNEPVLAAPKQSAPRLAAEKLQIRRIFRESSDQPNKPLGSLLVVVEALNATDEPADASGNASLMIMSKDASGSLHAIDRWDFTADETKAAWQSSQLGDGLHLELPLGEAKLPEGDLEIWARLVCPDGRKLLTQIPFDPAHLASIDEATEKTTVASAAEPSVKPAAAETPPQDEPKNATATAKSSKEAAPSWRPSAIKLDPNRVEGFATTAAKSEGWAKQSGAEPRIASAVSEASTARAKPSWQRSSAGKAPGGLPQAWTPDR